MGGLSDGSAASGLAAPCPAPPSGSQRGMLLGASGNSPAMITHEPTKARLNTTKATGIHTDLFGRTYSTGYANSDNRSSWPCTAVRR
ncbi:MAG: hypothetical protein KAY21_01465 [Limnohabitans sp.]|nr:hypothetical protein [Limnohabitans sp.]